MDQRKIPWKSEWKAAGLDPGPLSPEEAALVPELIVENQRVLEAHPLRPPVRSSPFRVWSLPLVAAVVFLALPGFLPEGRSR